MSVIRIFRSKLIDLVNYLFGTAARSSVKSLKEISKILLLWQVSKMKVAYPTDLSELSDMRLCGRENVSFITSTSCNHLNASMEYFCGLI